MPKKKVAKKKVVKGKVVRLTKAKVKPEPVGVFDWIASFKKFLELVKRLGPIMDILIPLLDMLISTFGSKEAVAKWGRDMIAAKEKQLVSTGTLRQRLLEVPKK